MPAHFELMPKRCTDWHGSLPTRNYSAATAPALTAWETEPEVDGAL